MLYRYNESMLNECVDIFYDIYTSEEFKFKFLTKENIKDYFDGIYSSKSFEGFVFIKDKKVVAFCLGKTQSTFGKKIYDITEICVKNDLRGQGIGKKFMQEIEDKLRAYEYSCVTLNTKKTIDAYDFYLKNGFDEKVDVVSMMKML